MINSVTHRKVLSTTVRVINIRSTSFLYDLCGCALENSTYIQKDVTRVTKFIKKTLKLYFSSALGKGLNTYQSMKNGVIAC